MMTCSKLNYTLQESFLMNLRFPRLGFVKLFLLIRVIVVDVIYHRITNNSIHIFLPAVR